MRLINIFVFIYFLVSFPIIAQDGAQEVEEVEEIADNIGPEEAAKIFNETKQQYHDINNIIQAGAKLEEIRKTQGEEACREMAKPYGEVYNGYKQRMEGRTHRIYYFINAATEKAQNCLSCDGDNFKNDCVLLDRALDIAKSAFGERDGERLYDTKKFPNNGMKRPVDLSPGGNQGRIASTRKKTSKYQKAKGSIKKGTSSFTNKQVEDLNTLNKDSEYIFTDKYKFSTESINKEKEKDLFRIISIRYLRNLKKLK